MLILLLLGWVLAPENPSNGFQSTLAELRDETQEDNGVDDDGQVGGPHKHNLILQLVSRSVQVLEVPSCLDQT